MGALLASLQCCPARSAFVQVLQHVLEPRLSLSHGEDTSTFQRHIYKSGAGLPPGRAGTLVSTEVVRFDLDDPHRGILWSRLVENLAEARPQVVLIRDLGGQPAPRLWEDLDVLCALKPRAASGVVAFVDSRDVAIRTALRGTD